MIDDLSTSRMALSKPLALSFLMVRMETRVSMPDIVVRVARAAGLPGNSRAISSDLARASLSLPAC